MCGDCTPVQAETDSAIDPKNFDNSTSPADNFFTYANGGWQANNPIPPEYPNWNTFLELHTQNQERIKNLLNALSSSGDDETKTAAALQGEARLVSIYYKTALDEAAIEAAGHVKPLEAVMAQCTAARATEDRARVLGEFASKFGMNFFFGVGAGPDNTNSNHCIAQIGQSGLGLPDRDYYFDEDKADKRELYKTHIANMLSLLDPEVYTEQVAAKTAESIYTIEVQIAASHMTKTERRDPIATYNKMSMAELTELCSGVFDFGSYFVALGKENSDAVGAVNVRNIEAIKTTATVVMTLSADDICHYLKWHSISNLAHYLPKRFVDEDFEFFQKTLSGTKEIKPRWKRAISYTESALGEALGKMYCEKYFDENCKTRAFAIVER